MNRNEQRSTKCVFLTAVARVKDVNAELGGRMRVTLKRESPLFRAIYRQRTTCERINNQAKSWGIGRPKVRNGLSVENLNTLIYLVINAKALRRVRSLVPSRAC